MATMIEFFSHSGKSCWKSCVYAANVQWAGMGSSGLFVASSSDLKLVPIWMTNGNR